MRLETTAKIVHSRSIATFEKEKSDKKMFYRDNLEHLEYLEYISRLKLIAACLRNDHNAIIKNIESHLSDRPDLGYDIDLSSALTYDGLSKILKKVEHENEIKVNNSIKKGIDLNFEKLSNTFALDEVERSIVMLLYVNNTGNKFRNIYVATDIDPDSRRTGGMSIGAILSIISSDYRNQIYNRKYFSFQSSLSKNEIVIPWGSFDETTNIIDETVFLHERIDRFISGDNNVYSSDFSIITKISSPIRMDQVVLPESIKKAVLSIANNYINPKSQASLSSLNDFYGYGTGLILFLYGPSGTGKTMLSHALSNALGKHLFMINAERASEIRIPFGRFLKHIFMEARLCNGIVFFDECDDIFRADTSESRELLLEIERAKCIIIMATNKAVALDPSLDRRITMKVPFNLPDRIQRENIWEALIPPNIEIDEDIDFKKLAEKYIFSGGLIKNALILAITNSINRNGGRNIKLTMADIERAADQQSSSIFDLNGVGEFYSPEQSIENLPIKPIKKKVLSNIATAYSKIREGKTGLSILMSSSKFEIGIDCANAVAKACALKIRKFAFDDIIYEQKSSNGIQDPVLQKEISAMEYAFSDSLGHRTMLLFVDYGDTFISVDKSDLLKQKIGFMDKVMKFKGLIFFVTKHNYPQDIPLEFDYCLRIDQPSEDIQINHWEKTLNKYNLNDDCDIVELVERYPLHLNEIDILVQRASLLNYLNNGEESISIENLFDTVKRYHHITKTKMLFGNNSSKANSGGC